MTTSRSGIAVSFHLSESLQAEKNWYNHDQGTLTALTLLNALP